MSRAIYEVYAKVVDANGNYNTLSEYPKVFDSKHYNDDTYVTRCRAYGEYHTCLGNMYKRDDRMEQIAMIIDASTGLQIEYVKIGSLNPDEEEPVVNVE